MSTVDTAAHGCVVLCSKGLEREFVREKIVHDFLLEPKHWLCVKTQATTVMFRGQDEVWTSSFDLDPADEGGVAFSPSDGASIAVTGGGGTVIAETTTGANLRRMDIRGSRVAWSRDSLLAICGPGNCVSVVRDGEVILTVSNETPTRELPHRRHRYGLLRVRRGPAVQRTLASWVAKNRRRNERRIERLQAQSRGEVVPEEESDEEEPVEEEPEDEEGGWEDGLPDESLMTDMGGICDAVFTQDGTRLIVASVWSSGMEGSTLSIVDLSDGAIVRKKTQQHYHGNHDSLWARMSFSPDGQRLALACDGIAAYTYDENLGDFHESIGTSALLAAIAGDEGQNALRQIPEDPKRPRKLQFGDHKARSVSFSPDGASLAVGLTDRCVVIETTDYTIRHRDLYSPDAVPPPLEEAPNPVRTVGEAIHCQDGTIIPPSRIIDVDPLSAAEHRESRFVGAADVVLAVAFSSTSNLLASATTSGVTIFDPSSGTKLYDLDLPPGDTPVDLAYRL